MERGRDIPAFFFLAEGIVTGRSARLQAAAQPWKGKMKRPGRNPAFIRIWPAAMLSDASPALERRDGFDVRGVRGSFMRWIADPPHADRLRGVGEAIDLGARDAVAELRDKRQGLVQAVVDGETESVKQDQDAGDLEDRDDYFG